MNVEHFAPRKFGSTCVYVQISIQLIINCTLYPSHELYNIHVCMKVCSNHRHTRAVYTHAPMHNYHTTNDCIDHTDKELLYILRYREFAWEYLAFAHTCINPCMSSAILAIFDASCIYIHVHIHTYLLYIQSYKSYNAYRHTYMYSCAWKNDDTTTRTMYPKLGKAGNLWMYK